MGNFLPTVTVSRQMSFVNICSAATLYIKFVFQEKLLCILFSYFLMCNFFLSKMINLVIDSSDLHSGT